MSSTQQEEINNNIIDENTASFKESDSNIYQEEEENDNENQEDDSKRNVNVFELPIEDLIERRDRYIKELKLEKAQEIDAIIDYIQSVAHEGPVQKVKDYLTDKITEFYDSYKQTCKEIRSTYQENEMEIRRNCDEAFTEMKAKHINQLVQIEKMREYEQLFNKNKKVTKSITYEQQAMYSARQKDYQKAFHFRKLAQEAKEKVLKERQQAVNEKIDALKSNILVTMSSDLKILSDKVQDEIKSNKADLKLDLDMQLRTFKVLVISESQKAVVGVNKYFTKNETKKLLASEISNFVSDKLNEITGIRVNIAFSPPASPLRKKTNTDSPNQSLSPKRETQSSPKSPSKKTAKPPEPPKPIQKVEPADDEEEETSFLDEIGSENLPTENQEQILSPEKEQQVEPEIKQENDSQIEPEITQEKEPQIEPEITKENDSQIEPEITKENDSLFGAEKENDSLFGPEITQEKEPQIEPEQNPEVEKQDLDTDDFNLDNLDVNDKINLTDDIKVTDSDIDKYINGSEANNNNEDSFSLNEFLNENDILEDNALVNDAKDQQSNNADYNKSLNSDSFIDIGE